MPTAHLFNEINEKRIQRKKLYIFFATKSGTWYAYMA